MYGGVGWEVWRGRRRKQRRRTGICIHVLTLRQRARLLVARAHVVALRDWGCAGEWRGGSEMCFSSAFICITHIIHVQ